MKHLVLALAISLGLVVPVLGAPKSPVQLIEETKRSMVHVSVPQEDGFYVCAGFVVSATKGWALTAAHCIKDSEAMMVNGEPSELIAMDEAFAVLSIKPMSMPPLDIRKSNPKLGEQVVTLGDGYGWFTAFVRHVGAITDEDHFAVDGVIIAGMSGGPVVDEDGKVVGINQAGDNAVGLMCGATEIRDFLRSIKK